MILVNLSFSRVNSELRLRQDLVAAIESSPMSCVVSGTLPAVEEYAAKLKVRGIKTFRVKSDIAFHRPLLEPL